MIKYITGVTDNSTSNLCRAILLCRIRKILGIASFTDKSTMKMVFEALRIWNEFKK